MEWYVNPTKYCVSSLKVQTEWNWRGCLFSGVLGWRNMHSVIPVLMENSVLEVPEGRVRGSQWCFLLVCPME